MQRRTVLTAAAAGATLVASPWLRAQNLPTGPIRIVVGFPPGGGTDALARVVGQKLSVMWNTPIVIENKAGAAGVIAADYVAKQPSDGTTLLMAHINSHALAPSLVPKLGYVVERDFVPIALVGVTPNLLICNEAQPAKTVKDLVALCKAQPGKISFASAGGGSAQHLALEMFKLRAGINPLHVPYKGSGPAINDLLGGQVNYCFETMTSATPHVKGGKAIAIAQTRTKRAKGHPNVPTMDESGFPGFDATTWYGLVGPGKLPQVIAKRMNEDINKVMQMPDVMEKFEQYGAEDGGGSPERFAAFIKAEQAKWAKVIKDARVSVEA
ncbi:MAG: tripartite tricarboxylate transporter substrate binding protein [Polaromonas sp.]|uniref:Bug family tripartite tricarboxylate transporter substrate binding protein n=1 Tax=Polaromonas sp. TaxID=1869339 RepID=UPI0025E78945|nr:tripartite tricarboxylate transporter substrate binding protein [Polaromonas sp.]MBI2728850.1 tripartite tricarboxylate transporter substrate binding protein [Polaromonas sp.]